MLPIDVLCKTKSKLIFSIPNYTMKFSEQANIKYDQLQQLVLVMSNAEYRRFECAVFNLLQDPSVFSEAELQDLVTKSDYKTITSTCITTVLL